MMERGITGIDAWNRLRRVLSSIGRYDLVLAVIPIAFVVAGLVTRAAGLPLEAALFGGATIALFAVLDGLFLRPPSGLGET